MGMPGIEGINEIGHVRCHIHQADTVLPSGQIQAERPDAMRLNQIILRNVISGAIAAVIFICIALPNGYAVGPAILEALLIGAGTFVVAFLISQAFIRANRRRA
jgi:hypothetical protein